MPSPEYIQLIEEGAFPRQIDPWSERGHYFHQLHGQMISILLQALRKPLQNLGYLAGRESSIQIVANLPNLPDVFFIGDKRQNEASLDYRQAVQSAALEAGTLLETQHPELDRIFIKSASTNELVTVLEIVSPNNKIRFEDIERYEMRRKALLEQGVHCVEIDLSRSSKRLIADSIRDEYPYHIVIHLNNGERHFIGIALDEALKSFGLPLRSEILAVELHRIYHQAYVEVFMAQQILKANHYSEAHLSFPSLINETQRASLLNQLEAWKNALKAAE